MVTTPILFLLINGYFIISFAFFVWVWIAVRGRRRNLAQGTGSAETATETKIDIDGWMEWRLMLNYREEELEECGKQPGHLTEASEDGYDSK